MGFCAGESILLHGVVSTILIITSVCSGSDWPSGWYGLPEPKSGCPSRYRSEWGSGWWYEDRRLNNQSTARVLQYSHLQGNFTQEFTKRYFCMKKDNGLNKPWPDGQYCIYQGFLKPCPPGFVKGSIGWKNKDVPNKNHHPGYKPNSKFNLPSGVFASNTRINYCCRVDGSKENSISLPINRPFLLLAYNSSQCQSVKWARTTQEYLRFSVQEKMTFRGFHPFVDDNYTLRYCYYQCKPNQTLTTLRGTVSQYLNQTSIHQERYTAWHIHPRPMLPLQFLVLRFTRFIFHASNITSYLEVFDGPNESAAASLGRFSSTQSPLGQNLMSINQLLVVLNFDDRIGMYDFEFNYHVCSPTVSTTVKMKTASHPSTPSTTKKVCMGPSYTSSFKGTTLPWTTGTSSHYNVTIPTNRTGTQLHLHGNKMLLLYTLLPTGGLVIVIIIFIGVMIGRRRRRRIAYSRLTSQSIDEIVSELNDTSCAVSTDRHQPENGFSRRTRLKLMDTTKPPSSDSDDELINA